MHRASGGAVELRGLDVPAGLHDLDGPMTLTSVVSFISAMKSLSSGAGSPCGSPAGRSPAASPAVAHAERASGLHLTAGTASMPAR